MLREGLWTLQWQTLDNRGRNPIRLGHGLDASDLETTSGNETRAPRAPTTRACRRALEGGGGGQHGLGDSAVRERRKQNSVWLYDFTWRLVCMVGNAHSLRLRGPDTDEVEAWFRRAVRRKG